MIKLLMLDIDGTLTDGRLHYDLEGEKLKIFDVKDGLGLAYWHKIGRKSAIITGRNSEIVRNRAEELRIDFVFMSAMNKGEIARNLKSELGLESAECAAIGDDMNDISMFREVGLAFAPNDCAKAVWNYARILRAKGGRGAVREAIEEILEKDGAYEEFVKYWQ